MRTSRLVQVFVVALAVFIFRGGATAALTAPQANGIECGCGLTGDYVLPVPGKELSATREGASPHGLYTVSATGQGPIDLTVSYAGGGQIFSLNGLSANAAWGFSPDDDRFVYHYSSGGIHSIRLFNVVGQTPSVPTAQIDVATDTDLLAFSPNGRYLVYAGLTSVVPTQHVLLEARDAVSGQQIYTSEFSSDAVAGKTDKLGLTGWGFSPDDLERTLLYAYVTGPNSVQWDMVNLATQASHSDTVLDISSVWSFSPCGDMLGLVRQTSPGFVTASLVRTLDGSAPANDQSYTFAQTKFKSDASWHNAVVGGSSYRLTANTAGQACPVAVVLDALTLDPVSVTGGNVFSGTVALNRAAPPGGARVSLTSSNPAAATVPASVNVPAGRMSVSFTAHTNQVPDEKSVTIQATFGGSTRSASLAVLPLPRTVDALTLDSTNVGGGWTVNGTVALSGTAPSGGAHVRLSSDHPSTVPVPSEVIVPSGAITASFSAQTMWVATNTLVTLSASLGGVTRTAALTVWPALLSDFAVQASIKGGNRLYNAVSLTDSAPPGGVDVFFASSDPAVIAVPASITIGEGHSGAVVPIQTFGVDMMSTVTITATSGPVTKAASVTVLPAALTAFAFDEHSLCAGSSSGGAVDEIIGGFPLSVTLTLDGTAPPGGAVIALTNSDPALATVPASVTIVQNTSRAEIIVDTPPVTAPRSLSLTASYRGLAHTSVLSITPVPITYTITNLGTLSGSAVWATAINNQGDVVGNDYSSDGERAFLWRNGVMTNLGTMSGYYGSEAVDINDAGQVAGNASKLVGTGTEYHAFLWQNGGMTDIGAAIAPTSTLATAINSAGHVVGRLNPGSISRAFFWADGTFTEIGVGPGAPGVDNPGSVAYGINKHDQVVGTFGPWWDSRPFLWMPGTPNVLIPLGVGQGAAVDINDAGQAVGSWTSAYEAATLWEADTATLLATPPGFNQASAYAINNTGRVVGDMRYFEEVGPNHDPHAWIYGSQRRMYDLNCLIPRNSGWLLLYARDINDVGQIVGEGKIDGLRRAYLLTPGGGTVPPHPFTVHMPLIAGAE